MSNYSAETKHPRTSKWEMAEWMDDFFGRHKYGVRFPSDGLIFRPDFEKLETRNTV